MKPSVLLAGSLAASMALKGNKRAVILDLDLRKATLSKSLGKNSTGVASYLNAKYEDPFEHIVNVQENLDLLPVGSIPPNPAELLSSNEMKNLLTFLRGRYKHVIIDSPPAISFTDAAILSTQVDGVVLVAMAGRSSLHLMRRLKQRLANIGARIYGVVLNGIKSGSTEYYYYGGGYYDYYGKSEQDPTEYLDDDKQA